MAELSLGLVKVIVFFFSLFKLHYMQAGSVSGKPGKWIKPFFVLIVCPLIFKLVKSYNLEMYVAYI